MLIGTDTQVLSALVKHEYPFKNLSRKTVEISLAKGAQLVVGNVVGKIKDTGEYVIANAVATDGSNAFAGAVIGLPNGEASAFFAKEDCTVKVVVLDEAPAMLNPKALVLDASFNTAELKAALYASIEAKGISLAVVA